MDQNHVAGNKAGRVGTTACVCLAIKDNWTITVCWVSQDLVEEHSEAVQVTNVERAEIGMECIVKKGVIDREIHWGAALARRRSRLDPSRSLAWRLGCIERERERRS